MIIHTPEIIHDSGRVRIDAHVESRTRVYDLPEKLWFSFPESYDDYVSDSSDPFAASLVVLASFLGEPLEVRGRVSPRLAYGLNESLAIYHSWLPNLFSIIDLKFEHLGALPQAHCQGKVASAFSGGIDSLYTVWSHLPENQPIPSARLDYALFIHGYDFPLSQEEAYQRFFRRYAEVLESLGIELLTVSTNAHLFYQMVLNWEYGHGGPVMATGMCLEKLLRRFYISSAYTYTVTIPSGTSSILDHWLSTDTVEMVHFGGGKSKYNKLLTLLEWPVAHELLHVCINPEKDGVNNCGVCRKCELTRARLEVLGALGRFKTFSEPFTCKDLLRVIFVESPSPVAELSIVREAAAARRWGIALAYYLISRFHSLQNWFTRLLYRLLSKEGMYRLKRRVYAHRIEVDRSSRSP